MLRHKNIDRVCCVILALTLLVSALFVGAAATGAITEDTTIGYENRLFDQSRVHTIDIVMDDWEAFLDTATSEEYAACHLVIDGESYKNVAIRGKGNTSLSSVATYGNDRYSFKVEFDQYQTGLTYHGLDKLSLNNLIQDNTYLKDYLAYTLMNRMGVAAPLCSFVQVNVNGEYWGLYLAVEGVEDAFLQRNYGKDHGELYKPDSLSFGGGRGNGRDFDMGDFDFSFGSEEGESTFTMPDMSNMPAAPGNFDFSDFEGSFGGSSGEQATVQPTATATPTPTVTPAAEESFGGSGGASSGMPTGGEMPDMSNMPQMPTGGEMPDMGSMPQMPTGGETPDMGSMPQMPTGGEMPDMSSMPQMPTGGETPDMGSMPQMPTGGEMPDMGSMPQMPAGSETPDMSSMPQMPEGMEMPDMGGFGGFGMGSDDVKLVYSDDDPSSYSNIFNNAKTDVTAADQARLIAAIKALNEGDTSAVDTDEVIRYMAVHNFLCNDDSYTGMMVHNYYLYEEDGVLSMIPWDYNLAYGGFSGGMGGNGATSTVNTTISRLVSNGSDSDRPMAGWITASEEYTAQYLDVYQQFVTDVFDSGWFASEIDRVTAMIDPYVQADPTAFCTYEEFQTAAETLKQFCLKRAQSVRNQLDGTDVQVDASDLNLSAMGGMGGGPGGDKGGFGGDAGRGSHGDRGGSSTRTEMPSAPTGGMSLSIPTDNAPADNNTPADGNVPANGAASLVPTGKAQETPSAPQTSARPTDAAEASAADAAPDAVPDAATDAAQTQRVRPDGMGDFTMPGMTQTQSSSDGWYWIAACAVLLTAALIVAGCTKNNR